MSEEKQKSFSFIFEKQDKAVTIPVTGAWGGIRSDGSNIIAHLFVEYASLPNIINAEIKEDNTIDPNKGERISRGDVTREVQTTVVLTPEAAVSIGEWLVKKGKEAKKVRDQNR